MDFVQTPVEKEMGEGGKGIFSFVYARTNTRSVVHECTEHDFDYNNFEGQDWYY